MARAGAGGARQGDAPSSSGSAPRGAFGMGPNVDGGRSDGLPAGEPVVLLSPAPELYRQAAYGGLELLFGR